jgi:hypothetical protein
VIPWCFPEEFLETCIEALAEQTQKLAIVLEIDAEPFGEGNDILAVRDLFEQLGLDAFGEDDDPLLVTWGAEISSSAGIGEKEFQAADRAPNPRETLMEITTVKVLVDDFVNYGTPEAMLFLVLLVVNLFELFEVVLDAGIEIRSLPCNAWRAS